MALYIPAARRRRRIVVAAALALVVGLVIGWLVGRGAAPSIDERVRAVRSEASATAAGLRVLALHDQAGAVSGGAGADLVLQRTRRDLTREFARAPWVTRTARTDLSAAVDALAAMPDHASRAFGDAADALAGRIEVTFGATG